jgi:hypothetical protein
MHCGVMVTGYNHGDWERLLRGDYDRPPTVSDAANMDETLAIGELSIMAQPTRCNRIPCNIWRIGLAAPPGSTWGRR